MLSESEIARWRTIAPSLVTLDFSDRAVVYRQGDRLASLFWLLEGIVKLSHVTEGGIQLTTDVMGPGGVFGSTSAAHLSEHTATSLGEIRIAKVTQEELSSLIGESSEFASFLCGELEVWQKRTERKLIAALTKNVETRLVETLRELALMFGTPCPHGYALEIPLTQQDIADLVFASRPAVTKAMNALRRLGALDYRRELICVNHAALESAG
ncbi:Crp/Fnr family transcriptional regulator [Methylocystis parvus]|uniref:Crp/Fnr family transcriptional regulator n=1 Tax=Methylocystis parvus TaxID=134 RepID=UPI003C73DD21